MQPSSSTASNQIEFDFDILILFKQRFKASDSIRNDSELDFTRKKSGYDGLGAQSRPRARDVWGAHVRLSDGPVQ